MLLKICGFILGIHLYLRNEQFICGLQMEDIFISFVWYYQDDRRNMSKNETSSFQTNKRVFVDEFRYMDSAREKTVNFDAVLVDIPINFSINLDL